MPGRNRIAAGLAAGLIAALLSPSALSAAPAPVPCSGTKHGLETLTLRSFHIEAKVMKSHYKVGQTAVFKAEVVRPAKEDPLGQGIPTDGIDPSPAEEVNVGVGLLIGDVFLPGFAITDADGKATIKVKIEKWVKPAVVDAAFYAWKTQADTPCLRVEENGFRPYQGLFHVKK